MGRCYEFGVEIHAGCEQAMVVTEGGGACECRACGTVCPGRFGACEAVVAIPGRVPPTAPVWALPAEPTTLRRRRRRQTGSAGRQAAPNGSSTTTSRPQSGNVPGPTPSAVPPARRSGYPAPAARPTPPLRATNGAQGVNGWHDTDTEQPVVDTMNKLLTMVAALAEQQAAFPGAELTEAVEALRDEVRDRDSQLAAFPGAELTEAVELLRDEVRDRDSQLAASLESYGARQQQLASELVRIGGAVDQLPAALAEQLAEVSNSVSQLFTRVSDEMERIGAAAERLSASIDALEDRLAKPATLRDVLGRLR